VRFLCTLNSSPSVGIHFESENEKLKELVLNNYLNENIKDAFKKRSNLNFSDELADIKSAISQDEDIVFGEDKNISLLFTKLFVNANNSNIGWGIGFDKEFDGKLKKTYMCGDYNYDKKDGNWIEYEASFEI